MEDKYKNFIKGNLGDDKIEVLVEKKADAKYECVSAASIVAKLTRDHCINELEIADKKCGSGYPSFPYTVDWLSRNYDNVFGYGKEVRFSWKTVSSIFKEKDNKCDWEDYDSEEEERKSKYKYKKNKDELNQNTIIFAKIEEQISKDKKIGFYGEKQYRF